MYPQIIHQQAIDDYHRDGVVLLRNLLSAEEVGKIRSEIDRYIRDDLKSKPADAATLEADGKTVRNLWRLEQHNPDLARMVDRSHTRELVRPLVGGKPVLAGIETFNKPARVGSGVPYHQDNAYFCQSPADMLTIWIAIDPVTKSNGPIYFVKGSHHQGVLPTRPSGVRGNSIGLATPPEIPRDQQFFGLLNPGDATIHHCNTIHHSEPNQTDQSRLGLLLVYRGEHTRDDPALRGDYEIAVNQTPPNETGALDRSDS